MLKILHTADIHLGAKMSFLGDKAVDFRKTLIESFESIYDKAKENDADLVIISGDLFNSSFPSKTNIEIVKKLFKKLADAGIYIAIIPGNHDYLAKGGVYEKGDLAGSETKIIVFNSPDKNVARIDELKVVLHAKVSDSPKSRQSALPEYKKEEKDDYLHVAIAHGARDVKGEAAENFPITSEDIQKSGFDYVALGDWHRYLDASAGNVKAFYPGSIEPLASDQDQSGSVLLVKAEKGNVNVEKIPTGRFKVVDIEIEIEKDGNLIEKIENSIKEKEVELKTKASDFILNIKLKGNIQLGSQVEKAEILDYFSSKLFHLNLKDQTELELSQQNLEQYPEYTIIGKFIKAIQQEKDLDEETRKQALQLGVKMLTKQD